jgi:hypothetical protein
MTRELSAEERAKLRAESLCDESTIARWARGDEVREVTNIRLTRAARKLHIRVARAPRSGAGGDHGDAA